MAAFLIDEADLKARIPHVRQMLRPIARAKGGPSAWFPTAYTSAAVLAVSDGGSHSGGDWRAWRFQTSTMGVRAQYYEVWNRIGTKYELHKAYLHFFGTASNNNELELLCLHSDPNDAVSAPHAKYKRGPHLHFAKYPEPHAHVALAHGFLDSVLTSMSAFNAAYARAIELIRDELMPTP